MNDKIQDKEKIVKHWLDSSNQNYKTMLNLYASKDYDWALFMGHLVIEKLLKALYVKINQKHALFTHDLLRLASKLNLKITVNYEEWLDDLTTFNINARYDNYKQNFHNHCTKDFTDIWITRIKTLRKWLISLL